MRLLALEQKDGTYLIRPFGGFPLVYQADKSVTGRLIKFSRRFASRSFWGSLLSGALALPVLLNSWSDHLLLATVIFLVIAFAVVVACLIAGELFILRHASRAPAAAFPTPKPKPEPARWRWLRAAATVATALSLLGFFYAPEHLPFFPWMWIATGLLAFALPAFITDHVRRQRELSGASATPPQIADRATQRRRILWSTLLGPLANPLALWMLAVFLFSNALAQGDKTLRLFGLLLASSYGFGFALGLMLVLGWGRSGLRWYLGAATVATLLMTPLWLLFFQPHFTSGMGSEVLWLSGVTAAFIALPTAIAFWLIARPDRYAGPVEPGQVAG